jgi:hypothetical protein
MDILDEFEGPFPLDAEQIGAVLTKRDTPGTYVLGVKSGDSFRVSYVGRSDSCLRRDLQELESETSPHFFMYKYAESTKEAFEVACALFHRFRPSITNTIHPQSPERSSLRCPICHVLP